jgi:Circularly permutated YpsA SLOG family
MDSGLSIGGWCPPGRASESGAIPEEFHLTETPRERSELALEIPRSLRTEWNVRDSDGTLILRPKALPVEDSGTDWTAASARRHLRPTFSCDPEEPGAKDRIVRWVKRSKVAALNVGGPSESTAPGIEAKVYRLLRDVFRELAAEGAERRQHVQ